MTAFDLTESIAPRSDQQNFDDYLTGPRTVTIADVRRGSDEQPVEIHLVEYPGKPYKPSKSMRRVLVSAWGPDTSIYTGRRLKLYGDPDVKFGGQTVGGIKIGQLSHIDKRLTLSLTASKGKRAPFVVEPLKDEPAAPKPPATPPISDDDAVDLARSIAEAATIADLDEIARDLKALELGAHRGALMSAWQARKVAIEAGAAK